MKALVLVVVLFLAAKVVFEAIVFVAAKGKAQFVHLFAALTVVFLGLVGIATACTIAGLYSFWLVIGLLLVGAAITKVVGAVKAGIPLVSVQAEMALLRTVRPSIYSAAVVLVLVGAFLVYSLFPVHYLLGSRDYGLYEINAVHISQTGSMQYETNEFLSENYEELQGIVNPQFSALFSSYLLGYSEDPGDINPQFLPMFPAALAVGYDVGGFSGLLRVNAVISVLSLLCLFFFAKHFFGKKTALLATLFLAVCPAQFWGARITQSEQLAQLLFLLAAYVMAIGWERNSARWLVLGGAITGLACFNRLDNYVVLVGLYAATCYCAVWQPARMKKVALASIVQTVIAGISVWYGFTFHQHYFVDHWNMGVLSVLLLLCAAALMVTVLLYVARLALPRLAVPNPVAIVCESQPALVEFFLILAALLGFAYFVRPLGSDIFAERSLIEYSWYMCALTLPLAVAGLYVLARGYKGGKGISALEPHLFLLVSALVSIGAYTIDPQVAPDHFWASRRWVTINFPVLFLFAAHAIASFMGWAAKKEGLGKRLAAFAVRTVSCLLAVIIVGYMGFQTRLFAFTRIYAGLDGQYEQLAAVVPDDAVIVGSSSAYLSVLRYVYGKNTYLLNPQSDTFALSYNIDSLADRRLDYVSIKEYLDNHGEMYLVGDLGNVWLYANAEQVRGAILGGKYPEAARGHYPQELVDNYMDVTVYRLTPLGGNPSREFLRQMSLPESSEYTAAQAIVGAGEIVFFGPYVALGTGTYKVTLEIAEGSGLEASVTKEAGTEIMAAEAIEGPGTYELYFALLDDTQGIEVVLKSLNGLRAECTSVVIEKLTPDGVVDFAAVSYSPTTGGGRASFEGLDIGRGNYRLEYAFEGTAQDAQLVLVDRLTGQQLLVADISPTGSGDVEFTVYNDYSDVLLQVLDESGGIIGIEKLRFKQLDYAETTNLLLLGSAPDDSYYARQASVYTPTDNLLREIKLSLEPGHYTLRGSLAGWIEADVPAEEIDAKLTVVAGGATIAEWRVLETGEFEVTFALEERTLNMEFSLQNKDASTKLICHELVLETYLNLND